MPLNALNGLFTFWSKIALIQSMLIYCIFRRFRPFLVMSLFCCILDISLNE